MLKTELFFLALTFSFAWLRGEKNFKVDTLINWRKKNNKILLDSGDREEVLARQVFIEELSHWGTGAEEKEVLKKFPIPDACFENDRNRLREFLISWTSLSAKKQTWYTPGMTVGEELWGHFYSADIDRDLSVDTMELMKYLNRNKTEAGTHENKNNKMRQLCLAELIQEGDNDNDDKLDFEGSYYSYTTVLPLVLWLARSSQTGM